MTETAYCDLCWSAINYEKEDLKVGNSIFCKECGIGWDIVGYTNEEKIGRGQAAPSSPRSPRLGQHVSEG